MYTIYTHVYRVYNITMSFLAILAYLSETLNCQGTSRLAKWHISSLWRPERRQIEGENCGKTAIFREKHQRYVDQNPVRPVRLISRTVRRSQHVPACPSMSQGDRWLLRTMRGRYADPVWWHHTWSRRSSIVTWKCQPPPESEPTEWFQYGALGSGAAGLSIVSPQKTRIYPR